MYMITLCSLYTLTWSVWKVKLLKGYREGSSNWIKSSLFYLSIYLYLRCKVRFCPVKPIKIIFLKKNQQSFCSRISNLCFRRPHSAQPCSHCSLVTCALGDLTLPNLAHTAHLLDCQCPTLMVSTKVPFISLFLVLGGRFAYVKL